MSIHDKYFTGDEIKSMRWLTEQDIGKPSSQWPPLITAVRDLMDRNMPSESLEAQTLALRWEELAQQHMGGNVRLMIKLDAMHRNEPVVQEQTGVDGELLDYLTRAAAEARLNLYAKYISADEMDQVRDNYRKNISQWQILIVQIRQLMEQGASPDSPEVHALAARWELLFQVSWGSDPALLQKIRTAHQREPGLLAGTGIDQQMLAFLGRGPAATQSHEGQGHEHD